MSFRDEAFDEQTVEALAHLFEQFWILRAEDPDTYRLIRDREQKLKRYIQDKFGLDLIIHQHFAKLEKIPVEPQPWMGMTSFQEQMDYAIFCCVLAYTEQKAVDEQFLLSDLAERIQELYPGDYPLDWTNYNHRRSLVRALKLVLDLSLIRTIDGHLDLFQANEHEEVLYEVTIYSRYFMRSYPDDLYQFQTMDELLEQEWKRHADDKRRKRVYRKLMMMPFVYRNGEDDPDFAYIRNFRNRLREDIEEHTPFRLEVFKNVAMLTLPEPKRLYTCFPDTKGVMDVALHTMAVVRKQLSSLHINELGHVRLTFSQFITIVYETKQEYGHGWSKTFREQSPEEIAEDILELWQEWGMVSWEEETNMIAILPGAARMIAYYPKDYVLTRGVESR